MTIKELERRTGLPRTSIRFYEQEGLLTPERRENNYRDYSEDNVRTLEKIKLLRRLSLDLDAIRRLQAGELSLSQALAGQALSLEGDRADLERYAQVCEELSRTETSYDDLDPEPWLAALEEKGYTFVQAAVEMVPQNYVKLENEDDIKNMEKLIDLLEDNDDVQNVWHNWDQE